MAITVMGITFSFLQIYNKNGAAKNSRHDEVIYMRAMERIFEENSKRAGVLLRGL